MRDFFDDLEGAGFSSVKNVAPVTRYLDKEHVSSKLTKSIPRDYLEVINGISDTNKNKSLLDVAKNINLYIKTKFGETPIHDDWFANGVIPMAYHKGLDTRALAQVAKKIVNLNKRLKNDEMKLSEVESKVDQDKSPTKRQQLVMDNAGERIRVNQSKKEKLEEEFYYAFVDLESSLGGIY